MDIKFYEVFEQEEAALRQIIPEGWNVAFTYKTVQAEGESDPPARIISTRTQSSIPLEWAPKLRGILTRSQGYDHLVTYRRESKSSIACGYLDEYCARSVAKHAIMSMFVLLRKVKKQIRQFDEFKRDGITGSECNNKMALVVGVGKIGAHIVDLAKGLRMRVRGVDIVKNKDDLEYVDLKEGIAWADVIFCAAPLTDQTRSMFDHALLAKAKKGTIFINISRGELSPIEDLKRLLEDEILGGLSLDVYEKEYELADNLRDHKYDQNKTIIELKDKDNCLFTPHNAFNTLESLKEKARLTVESMDVFLKTGDFPLPVPHE